MFCVLGELLATVLSLYMYDQGVTMPLPTFQEVLMCNSDTTMEEVSLYSSQFLLTSQPLF